MRILLRLVALWLGLNSVIPLALVIHSFQVGSGDAPVRVALLRIGLLCGIALGVFAAVELWRLRKRGRWAALAFIGLWTAFLVIVPLAQGKELSPGPVVFGTLALGVLASPGARQASVA